MHVTKLIIDEFVHFPELRIYNWLTPEVPLDLLHVVFELKYRFQHQIRIQSRP